MSREDSLGAIARNMQASTNIEVQEWGHDLAAILAEDDGVTANDAPHKIILQRGDT